MNIGDRVFIPPGLEIIFEDDDIVVVVKPSGLLSVPGRDLDNQDCVVSRLKALRPEIMEQPAVHRLDWETSGLMVMAKHKAAHKNLSRQFQEKQIEKRYIAIVQGIVKEESGIIELAFRLDPENRPYQVYDPINGKLGLTHWRNLGIEHGTTRIEFTPLTGRTHQLRLHSLHPLGLGYPIIGDCLYGDGKKVDDLQLHAMYLSIIHPIEEKRMFWHVNAPF